MSEFIVSGSYYARVHYTGDGATAVYTVPFPYIARDHVHVFVAGHETGHYWNLDGTLTLYGPPPAEGESVEVRRITPRDHRLVEHRDNLVLTAHSLNLQDIQFLYLLQEDMDEITSIILAIKAIEASQSEGGEGGSTGGGGGQTSPVEIDLEALRREIMEEVLRYLSEANDTMNANLETLSQRIEEGLSRLRELGLEMFRTAGFVVDEEAGTITLSALEDITNRFNDVWLKLDAHEAALALHTSSAEATDILNRLRQAEINLNALDAKINLNASQTQTSLDGHSQQLTDVFARLNALDGEIRLCARELDMNSLETRLHNAEIWLSSHGADVGAAVIDYQGMLSTLDDLSQAVLENAESIAYSNAERRIKDGELGQSLAYATQQLSAKIDEDGNARVNALTELFTSKLAESEAGAAAERNAIAAAFTQRIDAISTDLQAEVSHVITLASQVNDNKSAIQETRNTLATVDGKVSAQATLRLDANGRTIGYTMDNDGIQGDIIFTADKFYILNPNGAKNINPFYYNSATGTLALQGIKVNWADILNANITTAQIRNAKIEMGQINNLKVGSLELADGSVITGKLANNAVNTTKLSPGSVTAHFHATNLGWANLTGLPRVSDVTLPENQTIIWSVTWEQENNDSEVLFFITSTLISQDGNRHFMSHVVQSGANTGRINANPAFVNPINISTNISGITLGRYIPMTSITSVSGTKGSKFTAYITAAKSDTKEMKIGNCSFTILECMR